VLRRIYDLRGRKLTSEWRRVHSDELYKLYASSNIIRVIVSRRIKWVSI